MSANEYFYRAGKRAVDCLPLWMLRLRPFAIYSIPLASSGSAPGESHETSCQQENIRWVTIDAECESLTRIADSDNLAAWNGATRRAVVAWRSSEPIGIAWIATASFEEPHLGIRLELAHDEAWLYSAFVVPSFRRQGIYRSLLEYVLRSLRTDGFRRLLLGVTIGNEPSRRAHDAVGARRIGRIVAVRSGGLGLSFATGKVRCLSGRQIGVGRKIDLRVNQ